MKTVVIKVWKWNFGKGCWCVVPQNDFHTCMAHLHSNLLWSPMTLRQARMGISTTRIELWIAQWICTRNCQRFCTEFIPKIVDSIHRTCSKCFHLNGHLDISTIEFLLMRKTHKIKWFMLTTIEPEYFKLEAKIRPKFPLSISFLIPMPNKCHHRGQCIHGTLDKLRSLRPNVYKNATQC